MTRREAIGLDALRERLRRLHGPYREDAAYALALLDVASEVLRQVIKRKERAERLYTLALRDEDDRWAELVRAAEAENEGPPLRPVWLGTTWHALASLAQANAKECEWFEIVTDCARAAARARDRLRPECHVVSFHVEPKEAENAEE